MRQYLAISLIVGGTFLLTGCQPSGTAHRLDDDHYHAPAAHHGPRTDVAQCMRDNAGARVHRDVVRRYCECMDHKMSEYDHRTISQWERSHPRATAECERASGWR